MKTVWKIHLIAAGTNITALVCKETHRARRNAAVHRDRWSTITERIPRLNCAHAVCRGLYELE
jgi:hypothetical protein